MPGLEKLRERTEARFGGWSWAGSPGWDGIGIEIGAGEVSVAGQGGAGLTVDEEADLGDAGQVGVEGSADGKHGEIFSLKAGRVGGDESAGEVDNGEFGAG